jgi:translocation and assembly module TamB
MKKALIGIFSSFVVVILIISYVIFTENGLQLLARALEKISMGNLHVEDVRGKLTEKFSFENLSYDSSDITFRINHFELHWNPAALRHGNLHVLSCVIKKLEFNDISPQDVSENDEISLSLPNFTLPLDILLEDLQVQNIQVLSAGETMVEIDRVYLQMSGEAALIHFNTVYLQGNDYEVSLSGSVGVDQGWPVDITGKLRYQIEGVPELIGTVNVVDSLRDAGINLMLEAPYIAQLDGRMQIENGGLRWQGQLQALALDPAIISSEINGLLDIYATTDGAWKGDSFSTSLSIERIEGNLFAQPIELNGSAKYDGEQLELDTLVIKSGEAGVTIKGRVGETLDLSYILHPLETNHLFPWLTGALHGEGTVSGKFATPVIKTVLSGTEFAGQGAELGDVRVDLKAEISSDLEKSKIDAVVQVKDVSVEGNHIDSGVFDIKGSLERHRLHLEVLQEFIAVVSSADGGWYENQWVGNINALDLTYSGKGKETIQLTQPAVVKAGTDAVDVEDMCLRHESSVLCLNGKMRGKEWQAEIDLEEFNPAYFLEEWPGVVNVKAQVKGQITDDVLDYAIDVLNLSGVVKGVSLAGAGKVKQRGKLLRLQDIKLVYGDAQLAAEGLLGDTYDIDFQVNIPKLEKFAADVSGTINASGALYGTKEQPVIDLDFNGRDVAFADLHITALYGDVGVDLHDEGRVEAIFRGTDISSNDIDIPAISLLANGTAANHLFMINADTALGTAEIQGQGSYSTAWRGVLESATLALKKQGTWALLKDAVIEVGREKSSLESFCLHADDARICLEGILDGQKWSAQTSMESIPLRLLNNIGLGEFPLQGTLQGSAKASGDSASVSAFKADVKVPKMLLQDRWQEDVQYILSENVVSAVLDGSSLQVKLGARFQEDGELAGTFSINNIKESGGDISVLPLAGALYFRVEDITFVSILTDARFQPKGRLLGKLDISGNLGKPVVKGDIDLQEGEVFVADLGILLEGIAINVLSESNALKYSLKAQSGPGNILSEGTVSLDKDFGFTISGTITGKEFEIMNTDEYLFRMSPELQIDYGGITDSIVGSLEVPYGRITIKGGTDTVTTTDDVIIVDAKEPVKKRDSQFYADIAVKLGEDVQIDAYGLKSDLVGTVRLIDEPGKNLAAKGEVIVVNGGFSLYSAELNITRGRLVFSGGNVENPGVDFRAQRKIEKTLVGVDVSGTARDLDFQLFSEPPMEESNILGYILFGRALYDSSGAETSFVASAANALGIRGVNTVTNKLGRYVPVDDIHLEGDANEEDLSIVLGKHLTEDLFIGYGHNLFDEVGEFKVRYQLGNNFSFETNSSVESTSGDIVYTIER